MVFAISMSLVNLGLYCVQQLGVTLGVGAETILLVAYLQSVRDGVVDEEEKGFARAVRGVKDFGLFFIITSGAGVVALQFLSGQVTELLSVIVLFKWSLIGIALFMTFITRGSSLTTGLLQGLSAGTWYALFAVHILAPEAPWAQLAIFYAIWLVGFSLCWTALVFALRGKKPISVAATRPASAVPKAAVVITPNRTAIKPAQDRPIGSGEPRPGLASAPARPAGGSAASVPVAPPITVSMPKPPPIPPAPAISAPPAAPIASAVPPAPPKPPAPAPANTPPPALWLHVMPRTPEELQKRKAQAS